jgi:hypothetical protein
VFPVLVAGVLIWRSVERLGREVRAAARSRVPLIWRLSPFRLPTPDVVANPLYERAERFPVYDRRGVFYGSQWAFAFAAAFAWLAPAPWPDVFYLAAGVWFIPGWILANLVFPAVCVMADRQNGVLATIAATPLSATEVAKGTAAAISRHFLPKPIQIVAAAAVFIGFVARNGAPRLAADTAVGYAFVVAVAVVPVYYFGRLAFYTSMKEGLVASSPAAAVARAMRNLFLFSVLMLVVCSIFAMPLLPLSLLLLALLPLLRGNELRAAVINEYTVILNRQPARDIAGRRRANLRL